MVPKGTTREVCGPPPTAHNKSLPNVLLIGDSISMGDADPTVETLGYGSAVRRLLESPSLAFVQHNGGWLKEGQAGPSSKGVRCIAHWLGAEKWDVVHMNHGLHDVAPARGSSWPPVAPHRYVANLELLYEQIQASLTPRGQFIWATTTPVPYPSDVVVRRNNTLVQLYNSLAARLWESKPRGSVVTNDLYALVIRRCGAEGALGSYYRCALQRNWPTPDEGDVHFNSEGREYMALAVAGLVAQYLPAAHVSTRGQRPSHAAARSADARQRGPRKEEARASLALARDLCRGGERRVMINSQGHSGSRFSRVAFQSLMHKACAADRGCTMESGDGTDSQTGFRRVLHFKACRGTRRTAPAGTTGRRR
ncbi:hypothetical protein AB1Y20_015357 [Prymnesium parvum]|uniref:SGNH hydrolase-type esterase domain-containing protein n=1 Tax=Prymnesium parvum TaxID=97485 RepID=A0AB34JWW8_PRYPA